MKSKTLNLFCLFALTFSCNVPSVSLMAQNTVWPGPAAVSNVGIGTTTPTAKLSIVSANANDGLDIVNSNTGGSATLGLTGDGGRNWKFWSTGTANTGGAGNFQLIDMTGSKTGFFISGATGNFGLGAISGSNLPTAQFHTTGTVRFQGINTDNTMNEVVVLDANGNLAKRSYPISGATLSCSNINYISKVTGAGVLNCSQIFDNGTSVGIGTNTGFTYSGGGAVLSNGGTLPSTITLKVNGLTSATAFVATSDKRFKKDIKPIENALTKISKINGVTYNWKAKEHKDYNFSDQSQIGLIAQEVEKVIPEAVIIDENGYYGVNYNMIIPVLMEAIKEQQNILEEQKARINDMEALIKDNAHSTSEDRTRNLIENEEFRLEQNVPNPFSQSTSISYSISKDFYNASIIICDLSGRKVKNIELSKNKHGNIVIDNNELYNGIFIYSLVLDGIEMGSKRMIVNK